MTSIIKLDTIASMNYELLLKEHQLKVTPQRLGILDLMYQHGHISIDNLFSEIKKQFSSISLATLYKNISSMLDTSLITEVKAPEHKTHYEITKQPHAHLVCTECSEHVDIDFDFSTINTMISNENQFDIESSSLIISGKCQKCA